LEARLAYLRIVTFASGVYAGGVMVVDSRGLPLDFRYTEPLEPTKLQAMLYGKSLDRHVRHDVIFKHLVEKVEPRPALLLVDEEGLLALPAPMPVVFLVETRLPPLREQGVLTATAEPERSGAAGFSEWLLQVAETGSPLRFRIAKPEPGVETAVAELLLAAVAGGLDPVEPFGRVRGALDLVCHGEAQAG